MLDEIGGIVSSELGDQIENISHAYGELNIQVVRDQIIHVLRFLHDDSRMQFVSLIDICGVDYPGRENRFDVRLSSAESTAERALAAYAFNQ